MKKKTTSRCGTVEARHRGTLTVGRCGRAMERESSALGERERERELQAGWDKKKEWAPQ